MNSNTPTSVWLVIDSLTFGGIESHVIELAKGLKLFNVDVKVWLVRKYPTSSPICEKLDHNQIPYGYLSQQPLKALPQLLDLLNTTRPTVLHAHGYKASLLTKLAKLFTGVRQISTYHAGETPTGMVRWYDWLDRYTAMFSSATIAVSQPIQHKLPTQSVIFNNFVDTYNTRLSQGVQIAFVGRLSHEKGADRFLQLAHLLPSQEFNIYGSGPEEERLTTLAPANVQFHGHQTDMASIWPAIDVLVICSRFEGLPMTALEAMARGKIVMALNVGSLDKLIEHQSNGYLFDDFDALCQFYRQFHCTPAEELEKIRHNARDTIISSFSQQAVVPQLLKVYLD